MNERKNLLVAGRSLVVYFPPPTRPLSPSIILQYPFNLRGLYPCPPVVLTLILQVYDQPSLTRTRSTMLLPPDLRTPPSPTTALLPHLAQNRQHARQR
jgi:hypothetical protein